MIDAIKFHQEVDEIRRERIEQDLIKVKQRLEHEEKVRGKLQGRKKKLLESIRVNETKKKVKIRLNARDVTRKFFSVSQIL